MVLCALVLTVFYSVGQAETSSSAAMASYVYIKQNSDLFVGEGTAKTSEFGDDQAKALDAAKERARADLASSVKVRIKSETSEKLESKDSKVSEEIKSQSQSQADVSLENVKYMEFKDFPGKGQVTVLASLI